MVSVVGSGRHDADAGARGTSTTALERGPLFMGWFIDVALPDECRFRILSYLDSDDLAEASMVSRRFREDCSHESLPQERTLVINITNDPSSPPFRRFVLCLQSVASSDRRRLKRFQRLKVIDYQRPTHCGRGSVGSSVSAVKKMSLRMPLVTSLSLEMSSLTSDASTNRMLWSDALRILVQTLPNLRHLNLSYSKWGGQTSGRAAMRRIVTWCRNLETLTWRGYDCCADLISGPRNLKELHMDGACFYVRASLEPGRRDACILLSSRDTLEKVSIRDACFRRKSDPAEGQPIPQEALINFVRRAPNLQWFRSDLAPESAALLRKERPDVMFVS